MIRFSRSFNDWPVHGDEHLNISLIESKGKDLEDLLANAEVYLEDWHGNEGPSWTLGDLPQRDFDWVCEMFNEKLAEVSV